MSALSWRRFRLRTRFVVFILPALIAVLITFVFIVPNQKLAYLRRLQMSGADIPLPLSYSTWWACFYEGVPADAMLGDLKFPNREQQLKTLAPDLFAGLKAYELRYVYFNRLRLTPEHFSDLSGAKGHYELILDHCDFTGPALAELKNANELGIVKICGTPLKDEELEFIGGFSRLHELILEDIGASGSGLEALTQLPRFRELHLKGSSFDDRALFGIAGATKLISLELDKTTVGPKGMAAVSTLPLQRFNIRNARLSRAFMAEVAKIRTLAYVELTDCTFEQGAFPLMGDLPALQSLMLDGSNVTDSDISALAGSRTLMEISLERTPFTGSELGKLVSLPLYKLNLRKTGFGDKELPVLSEFPGLNDVYLTGSKVSKKAAKKFHAEYPDIGLEGP